MEVKCDDPRCGRIFHLMSYNFEVSRRPDGKIALTVTCPSCGRSMSLSFRLPEEQTFFIVGGNNQEEEKNRASNG